MSKKKVGSGAGGSLSAAAATLGSKGGKHGGPARAKVLTASERKYIASLGGKAKKAKDGR